MKRNRVAEELEHCRQLDAERRASGTMDQFLDGQHAPKPRTWQDQYWERLSVRTASRRRVRDAFTGAWTWAKVKGN